MMKRKAASSDDTTMSPSTASSVDKWERTNLRLPAVAPNNVNNNHRGNDDSLNSSATSTSATSGSSLTASASNHNHSPASHDVDYLYLPPTSDSSSSSSVATEENHEQHRSRVTTSRQKLLQHFKALDRHLSSTPQLANSTRQLLVYNGGHKNVTATNSGRIVNVLQGEMAHCTPNQADVLVSDDATTCHILALWSISKRNSCSHSMQQQQDQSSSEQIIDECKTILATIAHIDGPGYQDCIRDAVDLHYQHHSSHLMSSSQAEMHDNNDEDTTVSTMPVIELYIHIMGGYNDNEGTSHEITEGVLRALSNLSNDYANTQQHTQLQPRLQMILQTCAVSSSNDDGKRCPIGRGLALNVSSGQVYLAEVDEEGKEDVAVVETSTSSCCRENNDHANVIVTTSARGPDWILRHVRLWASLLFKDDDDDSNTQRHKKRKLQIIHHPTKDQLIISPFYFDSSHPFPHQMLMVSNDEMFLRYTSSSPEVEKDNFVRHVRETFRFMNGRSCLDVFEKKEEEVKENDDGGGSWNDDDYLPRRYRRVGLNGWTAVT